MARKRRTASRTQVGQGRLPLEAPYRNRGLFADYYLQSDKLNSSQEWQQAQGLQAAFDAIASECREHAARFSSSTNEAQTEERFIKPVLKHLGWVYEPQEPIAGCDKQPDYALLLSEELHRRIQPLKGTAELWQHVAAVGDAKRWELPLDRKCDGETPNAQITEYVLRSGVRWGILTNGRTWRLYESTKSRDGRTYYEVDLVDVLADPDPEAFRYFYLFFRKDAFAPVDGVSFLERVLQGSVDYATAVGENVRDSVYDALRYLVNGFLDYEGNALDRYSKTDVKRVHDQSLILLYRLIFILYAEDAGLLPRDEDAYRMYGLGDLHKDINQRLRSGRRYAAQALSIWPHLLNLFRLIDAGYYQDGRCVIPAYNGGLFSAERFPIIAHTPQEGIRRWDIGDAGLAQAIDAIAYRREKWDQPGTKGVDYNTLRVRHLGSIYEGLLELKPVVAIEDMIEQPGPSGKPPVVKPRREVDKPKKVRGQKPREFAKGEVYLVTDRGERKATGSYFTPEYIVNYIVDHTVGPLAEEAGKETAKIRQQVEALEKKRRQARSPQVIRALNQELKDVRAKWLAPYLSLKILDPAMGSGHFLVAAADLLSLAMATDPNLPPVPEDAHDDPQGYYKQLVANHCLFGVDLNWLAGELAKLSLWLHTVQKDKALSFLDHHLRCGNSLIGVRMEEDLSAEPPVLTVGAASSRRDPAATKEKGSGGQISFAFRQTLTAQHLQYFLDTFNKIVEAPLGDAQTERDKDAWFREMEKVREPYKQVANLWLVPYFGVPVTADQYGRAVEALSGGKNSGQWKALRQEDWFQRAQQVAQERKFFHWELEFPEAFFAPTACKPEAERGFDAVVGNPPYSNVKRAFLVPEVTYLRQRMHTARGQWDAFSLFAEKAHALIALGGSWSMIMPRPVLVSESYEPLRQLLTEQGVVHGVADCGLVFPEAGVEAVVLIVGKHMDESAISRAYAAVNRTLVPLREVPTRLFRQMPFRILSTRLDSPRASVWEKMVRQGTGLVELVSLKRGIEAGKDAPFLSARPLPGWKPVILGEQLQRYAAPLPRLFVQPCARDVSVMKTPSLYETRPKLIIRRVADRIITTVDSRGLWTLNTIYNSEHLLADPYWTAALLNSGPIHWWFVNTFLADEKLFPYVRVSQLSHVPIRLVDSGHRTQASAKRRLLSRCNAALKGGEYEAPLRFAAEALATHAALYGPGGKPELRDDPYWKEVIAKADTSFPGREDFVHDLLAMLARRMIDLNKQKQQEERGFLEWLESYVGARVDDMRLKTKIRAYHEHDFGTLLEALKRNKKLLKRDPSRRDSRERVKDEFETSVGKVQPLKDSLAATDNLIDQIVYRLYGLTDEEIAIVEETVGGR